MRSVFKTAGALAVVAALSVPSIGLAAAYIKFDGVDGESTKRAGWSDALSIDWGVEMERDAATGLPTGKRQHKPFTIAKPVDKASPVLMRAATVGDSFATAWVELTRDDDTVPYLRYELHDVLVSSFSVSSTCTDPTGAPAEELALTYSALSASFIPPDTAGTSVLEQSEFSFRAEPTHTVYSVPEDAVLDGAVFTLEGRLLRRVTYTGPARVADFGLSSGVYVLRVRVVAENGGGATLVSPIIVR